MIQKDKLEEYLSNGWKKGNPNRTHKSCLGRVCVTKDDILKKIDQNELEEYLSNGWVKGMGNSIMKGRIRINNGTEEKFVSNKEYENTYKELGYVKGLLKPRKTSKKL